MGRIVRVGWDLEGHYGDIAVDHSLLCLGVVTQSKELSSWSVEMWGNWSWIVIYENIFPAPEELGVVVILELQGWSEEVSSLRRVFLPLQSWSFALLEASLYKGKGALEDPRMECTGRLMIDNEYWGQGARAQSFLIRWRVAHVSDLHSSIKALNLKFSSRVRLNSLKFQVI